MLRTSLAKCFSLLAVLTCLTAVRFAQAQTTQSPAPVPFPNPFWNLGNNTLDAFGIPNIPWHYGAVASTGILAFSGADHEVRLAFQNHHPLGNTIATGAFWGGYVGPSVIALGVYAAGAAAGHRTLAGAGSAALQALALTAFDTGLLKWATARPFPVHGGDPKSPERLQPGFAKEFLDGPFTWRGSLAWPSGHTSTSLSVAAALSAYYSEHLWLPCVGYPLALLIGVGMIEGDHHWTSDVLAGAMIGHAVGYTVGKNFRRLVRAKPGKTKGLNAVWILPMQEAVGLRATGNF